MSHNCNRYSEQEVVLEGKFTYNKDSLKQLLSNYVNEEDLFSLLLALNLEDFELTSDLNLQGNKLCNLKSGIEPTDAVTVNQLKVLESSLNNLAELCLSMDNKIQILECELMQLESKVGTVI